MLYDPKWEVKQPDLKFQGVSLRELIAWLEMQDPDTGYDFCDPTACLLAVYTNRIIAFGPYGKAPDGQWLYQIVAGATNDLTYGAALQRARETLATL